MKRIWYLVAPALALVSACSVEPLVSDTTDPEVELRQQGLSNAQLMSFNPLNAAIYHFKRSGQCNPVVQDVFHTAYSTTNIWWPRPCSGRVVRRTGNQFWILTARHCVTENGEINGPLAFTPGDLIVTTALAPGVIPTSESNGSITVHGGPPPAFTAIIWEAGAPAHSQDYAEDRAIIKVLNLSITSGRTAIYSGTSQELVGMNLIAEGYGRSQDGHCYGHNSSGAGVLARVLASRSPARPTPNSTTPSTACSRPASTSWAATPAAPFTT
jgi:hypothetical protein